MDDGVCDGAVPSRPAVARVHVKKRALRNKGLSVGFDEKHLQDFVGGFQKRKKKRRKIAQRQMLDKERLRRIESRKQRRLEKVLALPGGTPLPEEGSQGEAECLDVEDIEDDEEDRAMSLSGTKTFQSGDMKITVTTTKLSSEDVDERPARSIPSISMVGATSKQNLCTRKKPLKEVGKKRQHKKHKKHGLQKKVKKGKGRRQ